MRFISRSRRVLLALLPLSAASLAAGAEVAGVTPPTAGFAQAPEFPSLEELEAQLAAGASELAVPEEGVDSSRLPAFARGATLYATTSYSNNDEVIDVGRSRQYEQAGASVGVRIPVLGSRLQLDAASAERELAREGEQLRWRQQQRERLARLRVAYVEHRGAQQLGALASGYLATEPRMREVFAQRVIAGLLLDSDRRELTNTFAQARLEAGRQRRREALALDELRTLLGADLASGVAGEPALARRCARVTPASAADLGDETEIDYLHRLAELRRRAARRPAVFPLNSEVRVGYTRSLEPATGESGGSAVISWTFDYPLDRRPGSGEVLRAARAAQELDARQALLRRERLGMLADEQSRLETLEFAREQLAARDAAVRERDLRAARLAGDVQEQLQIARYARYRAAVALAEAESDWLVALARRSALLPDSCAPPARETASAATGAISGDAASSAAAAGPPPGRTLYLWSTQRLLDAVVEGQVDGLLGTLRRERVDRLRVSLDAGQLRAVRRDDAPLRRLIAAARARGIAVELLLGDPGWILPEGRGRLLELVTGLRRLPFDALHLDLEPSQLDAAGGAGQPHLPALRDTLAAVRAVAPWRIGLSLHPRDATALLDGETFAAFLERLGVEPTLMIYAANPQRVVEIATPLLADHGTMPVRVAVSLESQLPDDETLARQGEAERERRLRAIETALAPARFGGLVLQTDPDWLYRRAAATKDRS